MQKIETFYSFVEKNNDMTKQELAQVLYKEIEDQASAEGKKTGSYARSVGINKILLHRLKNGLVSTIHNSVSDNKLQEVADLIGFKLHFQTVYVLVKP